MISLTNLLLVLFGIFLGVLVTNADVDTHSLMENCQESYQQAKNFCSNAESFTLSATDITPTSLSSRSPTSNDSNAHTLTCSHLQEIFSCYMHLICHGCRGGTSVPFDRKLRKWLRVEQENRQCPAFTDLTRPYCPYLLNPHIRPSIHHIWTVLVVVCIATAFIITLYFFYYERHLGPGSGSNRRTQPGARVDSLGASISGKKKKKCKCKNSRGPKRPPRSSNLDDGLSSSIGWSSSNSDVVDGGRRSRRDRMSKVAKQNPIQIRRPPPPSAPETLH